MFSFFRTKPKAPNFRDLVWITRQNKDIGLLAELRQGADVPRCILSSFEDNLQAIQAKLHQLGLPHQRIDHPSRLAEKAPLALIHTSLLAGASTGSIQAHELLFYEHHPLPDTDLNILQQAHSLYPQASIRYYLALDEPLFSHFGGERLQALMQKLGLADSDVIEHSMVSSALKNAQKKLAQTVERERKADTEAEWYRLNIK